MHFTETALRGVYLIDPAPHSDDRGRFMRAWCASEFAVHRIDFVPLQANLGTNRRAGTLRGMHLQEAPHDEAKLVRCTRGALFDVCVDLRPGSATFGRWIGAELTAENGRMLYVPPLCAHGYQTLADESDVYYMTSALYDAAAVRGLRHDDPVVGIHWPLPPVGVSAQDAAWPFLAQWSR